MSATKLEGRAPLRDSAHVGRLARRFAEATGRTPGSAGQRLSGAKPRLIDEAATYLRICAQEGRRAEGELFLHACNAALDGQRPEGWTPALVDEVSLLDGIEDARAVAIAQKVAAGAATRSEVIEYAKVLRREIGAKIRLYDAAVALSHQLKAPA